MPSSFTLNADVKLNPQSLNKSAKDVKQALGRITGQASEFQKSLDASTARVFAFGATTVVLNSVSQAFRKIVASTIEVEKRLVEINAIFQQSTGVINRFRETIFSVAQGTGQAFGTVADAAAELARQGLSAEETAKRLEAALILTRISGLGAEDSVKTLTAAINGFTSAALSAEQVTNKIVAVDTAFAVSAQDLAQGLARAGSTAEDAGVSFDELLGLVTAVEQRTARGGAVIGNAFKSIFTRLSRGTTISDLQALGVEIDATQTGVQKLQALSDAIEGIGDPTVVSKIKELAGGVFQINVVSAALKDLNSETSVFRKATVEAAEASSDAYKRNEELNKSLAASINALVQGLTNLAAKIGDVSFGPLLENLVGVANSITQVFNDALSPDKGNAIVKGFFKGLSTFISGPGLVLLTAAFLKIVTLVGKFAIDGFKALLKIGTAAEKIGQIQGGIVDLLSRDEALRKIIASTTATQAQKEEAIISAIKRENALLQEQKQLISSITQIAARRGVTSFSPATGFGGLSPRRAAGYIPNFARSDFKMEEAEARALGATPSVKAQMSKGTIGGRKFIMNDQETEIPNFGKNGDSAVIPKYAQGYIPNFAVATYRQFLSRNGPLSFEQIKSRVASGSLKANQLNIDETTSDGLSVNSAIAAGKAAKGKASAKLKKETGPVSLQKIAGGLLPTILTPNPRDGGKRVSSRKASGGLRAINFAFPVRGFGRKNKGGLKNKFEKAFDAERLTKVAKKRALRFTSDITKVLGQPDPPPKKIDDVDVVKGFTGAVRSAAGAVFDAALTTALDIKGGKTGEGTGGDFDVRGPAAGLSNFFTGRVLPTKGAFAGLGDFKFSPSGSTLDSMKEKTLSELKRFPQLYDKLRVNPKIKRAAAGYIPNFAKTALGDAIQREKDAGLPESRIRIDQSDRLKNKQNPAGLAVTNTRDEPNGLRDVFASGYIPNFAANTVSGVNIETPDVSKYQESLDKGADEQGKYNKKIARNGALITSLIAVTQVTARVEQSAQQAKQKEIEAINKNTNESLKRLESQKKEIEESNKSAQAKKREISAIDTQIEVLQDSTEEQIKIIEKSKTLGETLSSWAEGISSAIFTISSLNDLAGEGGLLGLLGKGKTVLGGFFSSVDFLKDKFKGDLIKQISNLGGKFGALGSGIAGFLAKLNKFNLPKIGSQVAAQAAGGAVGGAAGKVAAGAAGGAVATGIIQTAKTWGIQAGKFILQSLAVGLLAVVTPLTVTAGAILGGITLAIVKGSEYFANKSVEALNKAGDENAQKMVEAQIERATTAAGKPQEIELEIKRLEGEIAKGGEGAKELEAQLKARKIQLEAAKDLEVAAERYKKFGSEMTTTLQTVVNDAGEEIQIETREYTQRAKEAQEAFFAARRVSGLDIAQKIVTANETILTYKEKEASILAQREAALNQVSVNEAKIAALQQKILLARTNALADIERARKLIPKELLQSGTGALLDFEAEKLKVGQASFGAAQAGEKAAEARRAVFAQQEVVQALPEDSEGRKAAEDKLAELQEAYEQASAEFYDASNTYNESIKNAAVNTQAALNDIANQIKTKGGPAVTKAFENLQSVLAAQRAGEATGIDAKAAAQSVADTINSELKKQFAANAVAAGEFYAKLLAEQKPQETAEDIVEFIKGVEALQGGGSLEARQEVAADLAPLISKLEGTIGKEGIAQALKIEGIDPAQFESTFKKVFGDSANAIEGEGKKFGDIIKQAAERGLQPIKDEDKKAKDFAEEQKRLLDNYVKLEEKLSNFRTKFPTADAVLIAQKKLVTSLENASKGPKQLAESFENLESFGEKANTDIKTAQENIAGINESSRLLKEDITNLNVSLQQVANIIKINTDIIKRLGGGGGGTQ